MKPRRLPSGSWNVRIMIDGHTYSFTDSSKRAVMARATAFAAEHRENAVNPPLCKCLEDFIESNRETLSPSTVRTYGSILRAIQRRNPTIANKRIVSLDIASVVAGTKFRGDFEKRVKNIIEAAKSDPDLILFIDEFQDVDTTQFKIFEKVNCKKKFCVGDP